METSETLTQNLGPEQLTLFPAGSPANPSPPPANAPDERTTVIYGRNFIESLRASGRLGSWLKTLTAWSAWTAGLYSNQFSLSWRAKVITTTTTKTGKVKSRRLLFQLSASERRTDAIEFGLLPTITVTGNNNRAGLSLKSGNGLATALKILPTILVSDGEGGRTSKGKKRQGEGGLNETLRSLPPTPTARESRGPNKTATIRKGHFADQLPNFMAILPTPMSADAKRYSQGFDNPNLPEAVGESIGLKLQPGFAEWMMGFPPGWTELKKPLKTGAIGSKQSEVRLSRSSFTKSAKS